MQRPNTAKQWLPLLLAIVSFSVSLSTQLVQASRPQDVVQMRVNEEQAAGSYVGNLRDAARLISQFPEEHATFHFQLAKTNALFTIDPVSAVISTKTRIDREAMLQVASEGLYQGSSCKPVSAPQGLFAASALLRCSFNMDVLVTSLRWKEPRFFTVSVEVQDVNDNSAFWPVANVSLQVPEHSPFGYEFKLPSASDPDFLDNGRLDYFVKDDFVRLPFRLQPSANKLALVVNGNIDREVKSFYRFLLYVKDGTSAPRTASIPITIAVAVRMQPTKLPSSNITLRVSRTMSPEIDLQQSLLTVLVKQPS